MLRLCAYSYILLVLLIGCGSAQESKITEQVRGEAQQLQYDLSGDGKKFLEVEASRTSFFLLGELHGENEIPALLRELWPDMSRDGYRFVAGELSPWAADQLEFPRTEHRAQVLALWSPEEAAFIHARGTSTAVLWGCDMDEFQPELLILDLAKANPANPIVARMMDSTSAGYDRKKAPELLELVRELKDLRDLSINDVSLMGSIRAALEIDSDRLNPGTKLSAQLRRELLMKELFLLHYQQHVPLNSEAKVLLRFGRNHLHRGYDARGVSTLGNFIAEFAIAQHKAVFNVAAFGAGGKASLAGETWDADERGDDLAFAFLASVARYPATVFDLRPLRAVLHRIPQESRSPLEARLVYWADSYDAILCYKNVTPLKSK